MKLDDEQIEAHFRDFIEEWNNEWLPEINAKNISAFDAGRMFENLWLDRKICFEMDYLEKSGQLDLL